jgi:hypothetical protein
MKRSHSWQTNSSLAGPDIARLLCKIYYTVHNSPPLDPER